MEGHWERPRGGPPPVPEIVEMPTYSPHPVGIGEEIDWQRTLSREVLPPQRRLKPQERPPKFGTFGLGLVLAGVLGTGYALSRLPKKGRHL